MIYKPRAWLLSVCLIFGFLLTSAQASEAVYGPFLPSDQYQNTDTPTTYTKHQYSRSHQFIPDMIIEINLVAPMDSQDTWVSGLQLSWKFSF